MHLHKFKLITFFAVLFIIPWQPRPMQQIHNPTVELRSVDGHFVLFRNGEPYYIKGAGGHEQMEKLALYGGNSIRTWSTENAGRILDEAHYHGLTVTLGLEVGKQFWGENFNYWSLKAIDQKVTELKMVVKEYMNHPALLIWNVGNEVNLFGGNRVMILYTINRIAKMIHETDPNHPVMTSVPMGPHFNKLGVMQLLTPNVDILGINTFEKLPLLQEEINKPLGWRKAFIITEWGPPGPWEVERTSWDAPIEASSTEKAKIMDNYWQIITGDSSQYLGSYAFYWGHKYERTRTFFSFFTDDNLETETVGLLRSKWSPGYEGNQAPKIDSMRIHTSGQMNDMYLWADSLYQASIYAHDPDGDFLTYRWEIRPEGYDHHIPGSYDYSITHLLIQKNCNNMQFRAPEHPGAYRLFAYVYDGQQHIATQNIPFFTMPDLKFSTNQQKKPPSL